MKNVEVDNNLPDDGFFKEYLTQMNEKQRQVDKALGRYQIKESTVGQPSPSHPGTKSESAIMSGSVVSPQMTERESTHFQKIDAKLGSAVESEILDALSEHPSVSDG